MSDRFRSPELPGAQELEESTCNDELCLVGSAKQRSHTDLPFLMLHAALIIVFLCLEGYRIANTTIEGIRDATNITVGNPGYVELMARDFGVYFLEIIALCGIAVVTSYMLLFLLRRWAMVFFYIVLIGGIIVSIPLLVVLWTHMMINSHFMVPAIVSSFVMLVLVMIAISNRKAVPHAMQMFDETGKYTAGASNPFFSSALTLVSVSVVWWSWLYFARLIESADVPVGNWAIAFARWCARWYNVIVMFWMVQFIYECQCLVLAGSISSRFFNRETTARSSSTFSLIKYHLGTVSKNSLVLVFMQLLHIIFFTLRVMLFVRHFYVFFVYCFAFCKITKLEIRLTFLTRSVSTLTAMYGYSFKKSTRTLRRFWEDNTALPLLGPTTVGGFILFLAKIVVVIKTTLISRFLINIPSIETEINKRNEIYLLGIVALLAYMIANSILRVYEMSANTTVVCYCVDCHINNGTTRPYFMTAAFMEFTEVCKTSWEDEMKREEEQL